MTSVVVIGAGVGGLTAAALLARAGMEVTVLEAHIYPGGCAGTFFHRGYRFDAGATLAGGFHPGGPMDLVGRLVGLKWPVRPADGPAMVVHLPDSEPISRGTDPDEWKVTRLEAFGTEAEPFWRWQEETADLVWDLALRLPPWPPRGLGEVARLASLGARAARRNPGAIPSLAVDAFRSVSSHLAGASGRLRLFVDAQLLISAQAASRQANALYGAAALDLPRRGIVHPEGGMGAFAETLARAVVGLGGRVLYRQEATRLVPEGRGFVVETKRGQRFPADAVVANLTPWNLAALMGQAAPPVLRRITPHPESGWGAFTLYLGIDGRAIPASYPLHHQVVAREPLAEGNSIFVSLSPDWDESRAPAGRRAMTVSTHTKLPPWWDLFHRDRDGYEARVSDYVDLLLTGVEGVLPGIRGAAELILPGTPVTFQRFTRRALGWVGGFPQTGLNRSWAPRLAGNLWLVGDSVFPGQSTAATALGGMGVALGLQASFSSKRTVVARPALKERSAA